MTDVFSSARVRHSLLHLWRTPGLNRVFNAGLGAAPRLLRSRVEQERTRVREVDLAAQVRTRARLVPETELRRLLARGIRTLMARAGPAGLGDYVEFGVYNGTSLVCMYRELQAAGLDEVRLFGFDSFQGFPPCAAGEDDGRWQPGRCRSSQEFTVAVLDAEGVDRSRVTLVPGWFSETLTEKTAAQHRIRRVSVVMIDCDLYSSTKEALNFCAPAIRDEALVLFDEWHARGFDGKNLGEQRAFREFLADWGCFAAAPFAKYAPRTETFLVRRMDDPRRPACLHCASSRVEEASSTSDCRILRCQHCWKTFLLPPRGA